MMRHVEELRGDVSEMKRKIAVLRLGHRPERDYRMTTHLCLTARAFGADGVFLTRKDGEVKQNVRDVVRRWGGDFWVEDGVNWKRTVNDWKAKKGVVCHLTMYGMPIGDVLPKLRERDVLIVVGAEKVPSELYSMADHNIAVGCQPHSEVAALAVTLDRMNPSAINRTYEGAELVIEPSKNGKIVVSKKGRKNIEEDV
ncbi:MAG: tRNA (cytidine(56)-2'-O)-methyltransferase [Methermicoccaceae archaeon]